MTMFGNLSQLLLSSSSIATSLSSVIGDSVLFGMCSTVENPCGKVYGAGQYKKNWNIFL